MTDDRKLIQSLSSRVVSTQTRGPVRVAIDGRSAAGKSTFASSLASSIVGMGRPVTQVSIDDFHTPGHKFRSMREEYTPETYYETAFDYLRLREWVLDPVAPGGDRVIRPRYWLSFDDVAADAAVTTVPEDGVLLVEGSFLHRHEFAGCWDFSMWLDIDFETMVERAAPRDSAFGGDEEAVRRRYEGRYVQVHTLYEATGARDRAMVVIDNTDPAHPRWVVPECEGDG